MSFVAWLAGIVDLTPETDGWLPVTQQIDSEEIDPFESHWQNCLCLRPGDKDGIALREPAPSPLS
jgi:hypothetical protein